MSNWEDTVMSKEQLTELNSAMPSEAKYGEVFKVIAQAQAEITWDIAKQIGFEIGIEQGKAEGIRGVVEIIMDFDTMYVGDFDRKYSIKSTVSHTPKGLLEVIRRISRTSRREIKDE